MTDLPGADADIRAALRALKSTVDVELRDVLTLVTASEERQAALVPPPVTEAARAVWLAEGDVANGGLDQFVWNHGVDTARAVARSFRAVGALENADVIDRLADELATMEVEPDADVVARFLAFRRRCGGPFFPIPEVTEEVGEVLVEYAIAHADQVPDPDAPLPPVKTGQ